MSDHPAVIPYALKDAPALIERLLPVQKLSVEVYKERKAGSGQTLTALGSYWKGRKPLILSRACVLGCLLPATGDLERDLEIFEELMGMDGESFVIRSGRPSIVEVLASVSVPVIADYFEIDPVDSLPCSAPISLAIVGFVKKSRRQQGETVLVEPFSPSKPTITVKWRDDITEKARRRLEVQALPRLSYRELVENARRPEEVADSLHDHIWDDVNDHLGTNAKSLPELVEQLGIMRFGHRPRVGDTFCGSGQIPFEAARLGCDVYAADLNPVACMLTWGAFHIVGGNAAEQAALVTSQQELVKEVLAEIDRLGLETDGHGWRGKSYLYCLEVKCPQTEWMVPLLPTRVVSKGRAAIAELKPDSVNRRYDIVIRNGVSAQEMRVAEVGTVRSDGRGQDPYMIHAVGGVEYRTKISTLRLDYRNEDGSSGNRLRLWEKSDFKPRPDDLFQERLYAVQWMRRRKNSKREEYQIRTVTAEDLGREQIVTEYVAKNLESWQARGWIPDMRIEPGEKTLEPIRTRGWTYWHHLFPPRHLLLLGLMRGSSTTGAVTLSFARALDFASKMCRWTTSSAGTAESGNGKRTGGASDNPSNVFYNQALNTFYNYGCRSADELLEIFSKPYSHSKIVGNSVVSSLGASDTEVANDIYITDPPYGDAVKYEEILEFFIAWLRKNPPPEFADWVWDSRRTLAIKGDDEAFRQSMVAAYRRMAEQMPDNGIQVIMFTHQSGAIWADMANIVWAAGLQVTSAWYVVTETDSALRAGSHVKGTVMLVVRKRRGNQRIVSDDLAWVLQAEVQEQVETLTGLNQQAKGLYRDENLFEDADLQMAGYAAALRALTRYAIIDGRDMTVEALRPRVRGQVTFVDDLIDFAVGVANQFLVPHGIETGHWEKLAPAERFYLKLIEMEARGHKTLDNYQNFAKAFKVRDYHTLLASQRANAARLQSAVELGRTEMNEGSELYQTPLRAVFYALMELVTGVDGDEVLRHLAVNAPGYYDQAQRDLLIDLAGYLAGKLTSIRPEEASAARVLGELMRNQRL